MKRFFSFLALSSLLLTTGIGCKGLSAEQQKAISPIRLNYWTVFDDVGELKKLADEYKKIRPYVTVNIRQVRYEEFDKLFVNALADDVGPDVVSMHTRYLRKYAGRLSPLPAQVTVANVQIQGKETIVTTEKKSLPTLATLKGNYVSTVGDDININGRIYGLPIALDTMALYYNKTLLDQAGIPTAPTTWDEFLDAVKKTTKLSPDGKVVQAGVALGTDTNIDNAADILAVLMLQKGLEVTKGSAVTFTQGATKETAGKEALEALRFYTDFARPTKEIYTWNKDMEKAFDSFVRGKSVFYFGFAYDYARIKGRAPQMSLEVVTLPQLNPGKPANVANYWVESVTKKSKHQNEAWDFVTFITNAQNVKKYTDAARIPSPYRIHVSDQVKNPVLAPFASQTLIAKNWYRGREYDAARRAFANMSTLYLQPVNTEEITREERDAAIIVDAANKIQQTL